MDEMASQLRNQAEAEMKNWRDKDLSVYSHLIPGSLGTNNTRIRSTAIF